MASHIRGGKNQNNFVKEVCFDPVFSLIRLSHANTEWNMKFG